MITITPKMPDAVARQYSLREFITPDRAVEFLNRSEGVKVNRRLRNKKVAEYSRDMREGRWNDENPEPISISPDGYVINGQHRLHAVIDSETSHWFVITYNVLQTVQRVMDIGARRSAADFTGFTTQEIAVARALMGYKDTSNPEISDFATNHIIAIKFGFEAVNGYGKVPKVLIAPVIAGISRVYHFGSVDVTRLREFGQVIASGRPNKMPDDGAALQLREWLLHGQTRVRGAAELYVIHHNKTVFAIRKFLNRQDVDKILEVDAAKLFPLPS